MAKEKIPSKAELERNLLNEFAHWESLYANGGRDPFYADGTNLNLTRNHIIYAKKEVEKYLDEADYPEIYRRPLPPEVPNDYMARADEIRSAAPGILESLESHTDYVWLLQNQNTIPTTPKTANPLKTLKNVLGYVTNLRNAIQNDDLITMRRYMWGNYAESFTSMRKQLQPFVAVEQREYAVGEQLTLCFNYEA